MNRDEARGRDRREEETSSYLTAGAVAAGVAALAGGVYWWSRGGQPQTNQENKEQKRNQKNTGDNTQARNERTSKPAPAASPRPAPAPAQPTDSTHSVSSYLGNLLSRIATPSTSSSPGSMASLPPHIRQGSPDRVPVLNNINSLLDDIFIRFVQIKDNDFRLHYRVFDKVFLHLHQKMKDVDPYYGKYSSTVQFAGSHYDNLRIKKPDEFDMDIVISLPLNLDAHPSPHDSDIIIEPKSAGYVQLKMGVQFQRLPMRDGNEWQNNKAAFEWMDETKYLQRSKFLDWFKGVVNKALNQFEFSGVHPLFYVDGVPYVIKKSESGPAMTLIMENTKRGFKLDVDLVPALKFPESRWPLGSSYRQIPPECRRGDWMVVGKPIKNGIQQDQNRSWRIALHNQEKPLMYNTGNLRQALRLVKKLRDAQGMKKIASYYVKTLFFWEIVEQNNKQFWQRNNPAFLFKHMVKKLHQALVDKNIPYFWNKRNNLLQGIPDQTLFEYAARLVTLLQVLEVPHQWRQVARYLLTHDEFRDYNERFLHI